MSPIAEKQNVPNCIPAKLVEAVVRNRGLAEARVFDNVQKAKKWLTKASAAN